MTLLIDNSVWQRLTKPGVLTALDALTAKEFVAAVTPQILEYCHSARNPREYDQFLASMRLLEQLPIDADCQRIAVEIQSALWHNGKVRGAGAFDILIAAIGHRHGATIVHYDKNFATIAEVIPEFRHRWIAPPGTID